jgi:hypothetical protein
MQRKLLSAFGIAFGGLFVEYVIGVIRIIWAFDEFQQSNFADLDFVPWSSMLYSVETLVVVLSVVAAYRIVDRQWLIKPNNRAINVVGTNLTTYGFSFIGSFIAGLLLDCGQWFNRPATLWQVLVGFVWPVLLGAVMLLSIMFAMYRNSEYAKSHAIRFINPALHVHHQKIVMMYPVVGVSVFLCGLVLAFVANGRRFDLIVDPLLVALLGYVAWRANQSYWVLRSDKPVTEEWKEWVATDPEDIHDQTEELGRGWGWVAFIGLIGFQFSAGQFGPSMLSAAFQAETTPVHPLFSYLDGNWWLTSGFPKITMALLFLALFWLAISRWLFAKELKTFLVAAKE